MIGVLPQRRSRRKATGQENTPVQNSFQKHYSKVAHSSHLDFNENETLVFTQKPVQSFGTPVIKKYIEDFERFEYQTKVTNDTLDFISITPLKKPVAQEHLSTISFSNISPAIQHEKEIVSPTLTRQQNSKTDVFKSPETGKIDALIKNVPRFDLFEDTEPFMKPPSTRKPAPPKQQPTNRVTFADPTDNSINTQVINDYVMKQKCIDLNDRETTRAQRARKESLNSSIVPMKITDEVFEDFFNIMNLECRMSKTIQLRTQGWMSTELANSLRDINKYLRSEIESASSKEAQIRKQIIENPPAVIKDFPKFMEEQTVAMHTTMSTIKIKALETNTIEVLSHAMRLSELVAADLQRVKRAADQLKGLIESSSALQVAEVYSEADFEQKKRELEAARARHDAGTREADYNQLLALVPFRVSSIERGGRAPRAAVTQFGRRCEMRVERATKLFCTAAEDGRRRSLKDELRRVEEMAPGMLWDGEFLSFAVSEPGARLRFVVTLRISRAYPWCGLCVGGLRVDFGCEYHEVERIVSETAARFRMRPGIIADFVEELYSRFRL